MPIVCCCTIRERSNVQPRVNGSTARVNEGPDREIHSRPKPDLIFPRTIIELGQGIAIGRHARIATVGVPVPGFLWGGVAAHRIYEDVRSGCPAAFEVTRPFRACADGAADHAVVEAVANEN